MVLKGNGLREKLSHLKFIMGFSDTETVKLDFDRTPFRVVKRWALRTMKWHKLKGFLILKSSKCCYHVLFDRPVSWDRNVKIMAWVSLLSHNRLLEKWFVMQCIKECSTLRVSPKCSKRGVKGSPRIVFRYGCQENEIKRFLWYRKLIKKFVRKLGVGT